MFLTNHSSAVLLHDVRVVKNVACLSSLLTSNVRGISPKYQRILSGKSPSQRSPSSVPFCIREQHLEATQPGRRTR